MSNLIPLLIADTRIGLERDLEPWLLPNDGFPDLEDCYLWRGRIKRRMGFTLLGRLQRQVAVLTAGTTTQTFTLTNIPITPGNNTFIIGIVTFVDNGSGGFFQSDGGVGSTINYATGAVTLNVAIAPLVNTPILYLPGLPVMGLRSLENTIINTNTLIAFDTVFTYIFNNTALAFQDLSFYKVTSGVPPQFLWHGANYNLFWTTNYQNAMFATNDIPGLDGTRYSVLTAGATTTITITGNLTNSFKVNDFVLIIPDTTTTFTIGTTSGLPLGYGQITSSVFAAGSTTLVISVTSTGNSTTGTILNIVRQIGNIGAISTTFGDGIKWLDQDQSGWVNFQPAITVSGVNTTYLQGALMMVVYKGRLLALNTFEGTFAGVANNFQQRVRWCQVGTVYYSTPVPDSYQGGADVQSWRSDIIGRGGFLDAPTLEEIVSSEFVKDTLIVYFERSTWQLAYTGNELLPFQWIKINRELGAESTFSVVPFDRITIALGNVGIHACDSVNVERLDQKIPDEIFEIQNENNGRQRVYGIRDYWNQLVYWSIPYTEDEPPPGVSLIFPNKILVYNYEDQSYAFYNDSFTCFGYWQRANDLTWGAANMTWGSADFNWNSAITQAQFPNVVAGNQQGFVEIIAQDVLNQQSLFISNISFSGSICQITSPNHNLQLTNNPIDLIPFVQINGTGIAALDLKNFEVVTIIDSNNFTIQVPNGTTGTFVGIGNISYINNISILSKRFNPFISEAAQVRLSYIDFYFDRTPVGAVTVNIYIDEDSTSAVNQFPANLSTQIINTFPESTYQDNPDISLPEAKLWKRLYVENISQLFQVQVTLSGAQMVSGVVAEDIVLHGMILWFSRSGRLINV